MPTPTAKALNVPPPMSSDVALPRKQLASKNIAAAFGEAHVTVALEMARRNGFGLPLAALQEDATGLVVAQSVLVSAVLWAARVTDVHGTQNTLIPMFAVLPVDARALPCRDQAESLTTMMVDDRCHNGI